MRRRSIVAASVGGIVLLTVAAWLMHSALTTPPKPQMQRLADGVEVFYRTDSKLNPAAGYPTPRELHVDGDFFFRIPDAPSPLIMRSRLLVLTVTGQTALRITAYSHEAGEQVEVLYGNVVAHKSYPSNYSEPDRLGAGEMTMINRDIDLMEKEKADLPALKAWSEALISEVEATAGRSTAPAR